MLALLIFPDWYRMLSDKLDELNDRKQMMKTAFKPITLEKQLENEFMFTIGEHK